MNNNINNKKKTTSSKKKKKQSSTPADISSWVHSGKVDAKRLARKLPDVAAAVRSGSLQPEEVPRVVRQANEDDLMAKLSKHLPEELLNGCGGKVHRIGGLEIITGAEHLLCDLVRVACGSDENLSYAFAFDFFGGKECPWKNVREKIRMEGPIITDFSTQEDCAVILEIQQAYNRACEKWRPEIEKLVRKPMEEHCWAYTKSFIEFLQVIGQLIYRNDNFGFQEICRNLAYTKSIQVDHKVEAAARGVSAGHDTIRHLCWECGKDSVPVSKCSLCQAARYCSKECQFISWKGGHRGACGELKIMYQQFLANYTRIDQALRIQNEENSATIFGPDGRTLPPAGSKDYMLLPMLLSNYTFPVTLNIDIVRNGCTSIDHLYKNLDDIVRGRSHWMFEDTFPCTIQEYVGTHVLERANLVEMDYMLQALLFLTVDISKITPSASVGVAVNLFQNQLRKSSLDGELMPVTRFIEIYYRFGLAEREEYEDPGNRLKELAKCMTLMMKHFHKKKASFDMAESLMKEVNEMRGWPKLEKLFSAINSDSN